MSKSQPSTPKFVLAASLVIVLAAGLANLAQPQAASWRHHQTQNLVNQSVNQPGLAAESDLQLAKMLSPHDNTLLVKLAQAQIADGHLNAAIKTLAPDTSQAGESLLAQTQMSLQHYPEATASYLTLVQDHPSDLARIGLAKAWMERGNYGQALTALYAVGQNNDLAYELRSFSLELQGVTSAEDCLCTYPVGSPQAVQAVMRAESSQLTLAQELYALGLPDSSQRVLIKLTGQTNLEWLLRAKIALGRPTPDLRTASSALRRGLAIDPSNAEMHQLLLKVLEQQGDANGAKVQRLLLQQLSS